MMRATSDLIGRFDLPRGPDAAPLARRVIRDLLRGWGFTAEDWLYDACLLGSELVANGVRHGTGAPELEVEAHGGTVRITVRDGSPARPMLRHIDQDAEAGRGIRIVESVAERWGVDNHRGGKGVWAELDIRPDRAPGPPVLGTAGG